MTFLVLDFLRGRGQFVPGLRRCLAVFLEQILAIEHQADIHVGRHGHELAVELGGAERRLELLVLISLGNECREIEQVVLEHAEPDHIEEQHIHVRRLGGQQLLVKRNGVVQKGWHLLDLGFIAGLFLPGVGGRGAQFELCRCAEDVDRLGMGGTCPECGNECRGCDGDFHLKLFPYVGWSVGPEALRLPSSYYDWLYPVMSIWTFTCFATTVRARLGESEA